MDSPGSGWEGRKLGSVYPPIGSRDRAKERLFQSLHRPKDWPDVLRPKSLVSREHGRAKAVYQSLHPYHLSGHHPLQRERHFSLTHPGMGLGFHPRPPRRKRKEALCDLFKIEPTNPQTCRAGV